MKKVQEVFKRYEKKYLITQKQFQAFTPILKTHMEVDQYGKHTINNIYFDTPDFELIRTSIEGPVYKEKLRLRSYGTPHSGDTVFIEIKKKYDGIVFKRRIPMDLSWATQYLYEGKNPPMEHQILKETDWVLQKYNLVPTAFIAYDRIAMFHPENPDLRITFDSQIRCRDSALSLEQGSYGTPILDSDSILMEVKIPDAMPMWMCRTFSDLHIFPCSFSKYGSYYKQHLINAALEKGGIFCA